MKAGLCNQLKTGNFHPGMDKLVLIGHSYGAPAATAIAECLAEAKINVDILISIDAIDVVRRTEVEVIPENILLSFNYYEDVDAMGLQGKKITRRAHVAANQVKTLQMQDGVWNQYVPLVNPVLAHSSGMLGYLEDKRLIPHIFERYLKITLGK